MKSINRLIISSIFFVLFGCHSLQSELSEPQLLRKDYESTLDNQAHQYLVYLPSGYAQKPNKKWPVILFLHGSGERGNGRDELDHVLAHGPLYEAWIQKKPLPFIIISPQLAARSQENIAEAMNRHKANIPQRLAKGVPAREPMFATQGNIQPASEITDAEIAAISPLLPEGWEIVEQDLLAMISNTEADYRVDPSRLYLTGLSYGGFGTWYMASKHPTLFAAIAPVVGWGHPSLMAPVAQHQIPVWVFAGGRDDKVDKKWFYPGLSTLETLGHKDLRFTVEETMAHDTWKPIYAGEDLYNWFLSHHINPR